MTGVQTCALPISRGAEDDGASSDDDGGGPELDGEAELPRQSFISASSGDAYLLHSARPSKTSDALLSASIDPAFTLPSYAAALAKFDATRPPAPRDDAHRFATWRYELQQGFSVLLYGFGSKRAVLNAFAERARKHADAIVVDGFDPAVTIQDIAGALEQLVKADRDEPPKAKKVTGGKPQVSPIEARIRRVREALSADERSRDVYLVVHNLDGPNLRAPKNLSLLALLAAHERVHLLASVDHLRAPLLFPQALAHARPLPHPDSRAFAFVYHEVATLEPYTTEVAASALLSRVLPPTVFPRVAAAGSASFSPATSAIYVLKSVTVSSQKVFVLLAALQQANTDALDPAIVRAANLHPTNLAAPAPRISTSLELLYHHTSEQLITVGGPEKVEALLAEFRDHGVVKSSVVPPEEEPDDTNGTVWLWIALGADELEDVLESKQWKE